MVRADSTSNEVFITCNHVVRFNQEPSNRLQREADVCAHLRLELPGRRWLPEVEAYGGRPGSDYLIVVKQEGASLSRRWPFLCQGQRRRAIAQLAGYLRELHGTDRLDRIPAIENPPHLIGGCDQAAPLFDGLDRLAQTPNVDPGLVTDARWLAEEAAGALRGDCRMGLIHGDLTLENMLWNGQDITALIDLEWARPAPVDLELDILARYCAMPEVHVSPNVSHHQRGEDYRHVAVWLSEDYPELFGAEDLGQRLMVYALGYEVRDTLANPPSGDKMYLSRFHPYKRLGHLVATGGHVNDWLVNLDLPTV